MHLPALFIKRHPFYRTTPVANATQHKFTGHNFHLASVVTIPRVVDLCYRTNRFLDVSIVITSDLDRDSEKFKFHRATASARLFGRRG